jgi:hypothetical protein
VTRDQALKLAVSAYVKATIGTAGASATIFHRAIGVFQLAWNDDLGTNFGRVPVGGLALDGQFGTNSSKALFWLLGATSGIPEATTSGWSAVTRSQSQLAVWAQRNTAVMGMGPEASFYAAVNAKLRDPSQTVQTILTWLGAAVRQYVEQNASAAVPMQSSQTATVTNNVATQIPTVTVTSSQQAAVQQTMAATDTRKLQDIAAAAAGVVAPIATVTGETMLIVGDAPNPRRPIPTAAYVVGGGALLFLAGYAIIRARKGSR